MSDVQSRIGELVANHEYLLFMKGDRGAPRCGFSGRVVEILDGYLPEYQTVDVLSDPEIREGIKEFSSWPTIPQLYVKGEFLGGCDIVTEMHAAGELAEALGAKKLVVTPPEIRVSPAALKALTEFAEGGIPSVRLEVAPGWRYGMDLEDAGPGDLTVEGEGYVIVVKPKDARKLKGVLIDFVEGPEGGGFRIDNPNEPPKVKLVSAAQLKTWLAEGKPLELFDVRGPDEIAAGTIEGSTPLDEAGAARLNALLPTTPVVFFCKVGLRSQRAAVAALDQGFTEVYNLEGGFDAWRTLS